MNTTNVTRSASACHCATDSSHPIYTLLPGLLVAALLAWLSIRLSAYIGTNLMGFEKSPVSPVMLAILLGLIVGNTITLPESLRPGLTFAVKKVLRLGIILLGIRLSIFDVLELGIIGVPIVLLCILSALFFTTLLNRWLDLPARLGTLIAVGTSICGVSAICATGPAIDAKEEEVSYAVAVITIFGLLAILIYPYAANAIFDGDPTQAGFFLGTAVHDTSQVTGAAMIFADIFALPRALDVATVTKLVRNVFMAAVIPLMSLYYGRQASDEDQEKGQGACGTKRTKLIKLLPLFVVGFLMLAILRSIGDAEVKGGGLAFWLWDGAAWKEVYGLVKHWAVNFLVIALAGVGLSTRFRTLQVLGIKPFIVGLGAALMVGVVSLITISLLGNFLTF